MSGEVFYPKLLCSAVCGYAAFFNNRFFTLTRKLQLSQLRIAGPHKKGCHEILSWQPDIIQLYCRSGVLFLESADRYTVPGFFGKHVADTFAFGYDAVSCNAVFLHESGLHGLSTCGGKLDVEFL